MFLCLQITVTEVRQRGYFSTFARQCRLQNRIAGIGSKKLKRADHFNVFFFYRFNASLLNNYFSARSED